MELRQVDTGYEAGGAKRMVDLKTRGAGLLQ
jgi:hypothetical protein